MKKYRTIILSVTCLLIGASVYLGGVMVFSSLRQASADRKIRRLSTFEEKEKNFVRLKKDQGAWKSAGDEYRKFKEQYIMDFSLFPSFRDNLQKQFNENGLRPVKFNYRIKSLPDKILRVTLNFSVSGTYPALKKLIYQVMNNRKIVYFSEVKMRKHKRDLIGEFALEAYFVR